MNVLPKTVSIRGVTLRYLTLILVFALAGVLSMAMMGFYSSREATQRHEAFELDVLKRDIGSRVGFYRRIATTYAGRQEVADILIFGDVGRAVLWAEEVRDFLPESIGVALINSDGNVLGEPPQLHLGKQCVADLKKMLGGTKLPQPPVHREVTTMHHFDVTIPVRSDGETLGLLFMSFSTDIVKSRLAELVGDKQYLLVADGKGNTIAQAGNRRLSEDGRSLWATIPGTDWQMRFKGYEVGYSHLFLVAMLLSGVIFIVIITLTIYFSSRLLRLFSVDLNQIRNLLQGVHKGSGTLGQQRKVQLQETESIMEDVSVLVQRIEQANRSLKKLSTHDPLTGLYNRRAFDEELERYAGLAKRGTVSRVVLLDLDKFKPVNDHYGHHIGDEVLIALSSTLSERCRSSDILARLGGDEFALIMPAYEGEIDLWFKDVMAQFRKKQLQLNGGEGIEPVCSISAGSIVLDEGSAAEAKVLMQRVDEKLYQAKRGGRGIIVH